MSIEQGNNNKDLETADFSAAYESTGEKSSEPVVFHSVKKINIVGGATTKSKLFDPEQLGKSVLNKDEGRMQEIKNNQKKLD